MKEGLKFLGQSLVSSLVFVVSVLTLLALALVAADQFLFWEGRQGSTCKFYDSTRCRHLRVAMIEYALDSPLPSNTAVVHSRTYRDGAIAYLDADLEFAGPARLKKLETSEPGYLVSVTKPTTQEGVTGVFIRIEARNGIRGISHYG